MILLSSISLVFEAILEWACIRHGAFIRGECLMQSWHLGGGGGAYWIQGVYSRVGVYEMIYGKHVAPSKHVYWKNDAIMQIEANLINNVWKTRKKIGLQNRKINVKILLIYYASLHSHLKKEKICALSRSCLA